MPDAEFIVPVAMEIVRKCLLLGLLAAVSFSFAVGRLDALTRGTAHVDNRAPLRGARRVVERLGIVVATMANLVIVCRRATS